MPVDLRTIAEAQKKALALIENPERRQILEHFIESSGPLIESEIRDALQILVKEINAQLAPGARLRLVQEGSTVVPEIVFLGDEARKERPLSSDNDSISKVLVRMPSDVKAKAADAAQKAGTSMNNWTVSVLERALVSLRDRQEKSSSSEDPGGPEDETIDSTPQTSEPGDDSGSQNIQ